MPIDPMLFKRKHAEEMNGVAPVDQIPPAPEPVAPPPAPVFESDEKPEDAQVSASEFKQQLDNLDALIANENGINQFNIDLVRGYVMKIMVDMKNQPELDNILIDRDAHNILHYIRTVKDKAAGAKIQKAEKKAVKAKKGKMGAVKFGLDDLPSGLQDLAGLKTL